MPFRQGLLGMLCALLVSAPALAQTRFEVTGREGVGALPGLQIFAVRDSLLSTCYTLFIMDTARQPANQARPEPPSILEAASERDRRLDQLSTDFDRAVSTTLPGMISPSSLRYQWEGAKIQSDYERVLRERDVSRLEDQLVQIAASPRLAVAGPVPCGTTAATPPAPPRE